MASCHVILQPSPQGFSLAPLSACSLEKCGREKREQLVSLGDITDHSRVHEKWCDQHVTREQGTKKKSESPTGVEHMTFCTPVRCSNNWTRKGSWRAGPYTRFMPWHASCVLLRIAISKSSCARWIKNNGKFKAGWRNEKWCDQHVTSTGKRKNLSPRQELN